VLGRPLADQSTKGALSVDKSIQEIVTELFVSMVKDVPRPESLLMNYEF